MRNPVEALEVTAVQLSTQDDVRENLFAARAMVLQAARRGARLVVLPENLAFMGPEWRKREIAATLERGSQLFEALSMAASDAQVWLIAGGIPEKSDDPLRPYNTCAVFSPDGALVASYRKIHLFDVDLPDGTRLLESEACLAGSTPRCVDIDGVRVGLSICYDLRFPELYRRLADMGAQVVVVPSAFTVTTGKDHWHVLLRARAIENQVYVVAAAQCGKHPKRTTYGKTLIVDPWGTVVAQCSDGVGMCHHALDLAYLEEVRRSLPALRHRRA
jgi:predicted amidohydrolase